MHRSRICHVTNLKSNIVKIAKNCYIVVCHERELFRCSRYQISLDASNRRIPVLKAGYEIWK